MHYDCPVVDSGDPPRAPRVCTCECTACKRAWWDKGRPIVRNGKIITA